MEFSSRVGHNLTIDLHSGVPKIIRMSQFRFQQINWLSCLYIAQKFGEIPISDP